jgi:hypothetical protein
LTSQFVTVFEGHPRRHSKFNYTCFGFGLFRIWAAGLVEFAIFEKRKALADSVKINLKQ